MASAGRFFDAECPNNRSATDSIDEMKATFIADQTQSRLACL
jgi:hypothetical protein